MASLSKIRRPDKWKQYAGDTPTVYPPGAPPTQEYIEEGTGADKITIPPSDYKYIDITFHVTQRRDRQAADYDKQQVNVLKGIREEIQDLSRKIG